MVKTRINGELWTVKVISLKEMQGHAQDDTTAGLTHWDAKTIYISEDSVTAEIIRHELCHAYIGYLHLAGQNEIVYEAIEEIFAEWFGHRSPTVNRQATRILNKLKKQREENNERRKKVRSRKSST